MYDGYNSIPSVYSVKMLPSHLDMAQATPRYDAFYNLLRNPSSQHFHPRPNTLLHCHHPFSPLPPPSPHQPLLTTTSFTPHTTLRSHNHPTTLHPYPTRCPLRLHSILHCKSNYGCMASIKNIFTEEATILRLDSSSKLNCCFFSFQIDDGMLGWRISPVFVLQRILVEI